MVIFVQMSKSISKLWIYSDICIIWIKYFDEDFELQ